MKILCFGDVHWSEYSSIVRSMGSKFSTRLENLIKSVDWVIDTVDRYAYENRCDMVIGLGDFFDKESLNSREITALSSTKLSKIECYTHDVPLYFITGNHEMGSNDLFYNSANVFNFISGCECFSEPASDDDGDNSDVEICLLPYILENNRKPLEEYFGKKTNKKRIIFSHNDIAGVQMGSFLSTSGFSVDEIEENCDLFINGHYHSGSAITSKIINLGNLTGQNFSEDAFKYAHRIAVIDTDTLSIEYIENPYAFNFYKVDMTDIYSSMSNKLFKKNAVVSVTCNEDNYEDVKKLVLSNKNIIASRVLMAKGYISSVQGADDGDLNMSDHLDRFRKYVLDNIGSSEDIIDELNRVLN